MSVNTASLFCNLVRMPSPSGKELNVAKFIKAYLKKSGMDSYFDGSGKKVNSSSGNLILELNGTGPTVMFVSHIDTVETGDSRITPIIKGGKIISGGDTILGVDNKAAVAALISALVELKKDRNHSNIVAVFSVREENGVMGIKYLKPRRHIDYAFIIDGSMPVGTFMTKALGQTPFEIELNGKQVHSAWAEDGINAMKAAGIIISRKRLGRHHDGSYVNISGVKSDAQINIVPGRTSLLGEVRGFTDRSISMRFSEIEKASKEACRLTGSTYSIIKKRSEGAPPFNMRSNTGILDIAKKAANNSGVEFKTGEVKGTTEANMLSKSGYPVIIMSRGGSMPHSNSESIRIEELDKLKELIISISRCAK